MSIRKVLPWGSSLDKGARSRVLLPLASVLVVVLLVMVVGVPLYTNWTTAHEFSFVEKQARAEFKKCVSDVLSDNGVMSFDPRNDNRITQIALSENRWARVHNDQGEDIGQPDRTIMTGLTNCYALTLGAAEHPEG